MDLQQSSLSFLRLKVRPSLIGITRGTYVVVTSMRPSALRRITLLVMKSDRFRSAPSTLQPMLTGTTGGRCEPSGASLSASNLFDRIEHAAPFVGAHDTIGEEVPSQARSGKRRMCSPGLAYDPSSESMRTSTARLTAAMQGLQGPGSRPCLFVRRMIPIGPQRFCGPLSALKPHSHGAASCVRLRRPGCDAPVRSRAWRARRAAGRVRSRRLAVTCAADKARGHRRRC